MWKGDLVKTTLNGSKTAWGAVLHGLQTSGTEHSWFSSSGGLFELAHKLRGSNRLFPFFNGRLFLILCQICDFSQSPIFLDTINLFNHLVFLFLHMPTFTIKMAIIYT